MTVVARFGADALTRPYDNEEIATIATRIALGTKRQSSPGITQTHPDICSELVQTCFAARGC
jgi:hypothetical protein